MFRLTREVRLNVALVAASGETGEKPAAGSNGHAGTPPLDGVHLPIVVRIALAGEPDAASSYVRNIKQVDTAVSSIGLPILRDVLLDTAGSYIGAAARLFDALENQWPPCKLVALSVLPSPMTEYVVLQKDPAMMRLSHRFEFSASHRLHNPAFDDTENRRLFGKCNNPLGHGHNYEVQVTLRSSDTFPPTAELEKLVDLHAIDRLDHKNLNQEVDAFADVNPSVEMIAKVIFHWLKEPLGRGAAALESVTVWETPRTWCEYSQG